MRAPIDFVEPKTAHLRLARLKYVADGFVAANAVP